jgi:hypothetical protein
MPDTLPSSWTARLAALAIVLAAGAAWALATLLLRGEAAFMAAPAAFAAVTATRWAGLRRGWLAALAAAAMTLFAAAYALYLWAAALIAGGVGLGFGQALLRTGPGLASAMLGARMSTTDHAIIIGCTLLAAIIAATRARHS